MVNSVSIIEIFNLINHAYLHFDKITPVVDDVTGLQSEDRIVIDMLESAGKKLIAYDKQDK